LGLPVVSSLPPVPRPAAKSAVRAAVAASDDRVRLMVRLASEMGLRRGEVSRVHSEDMVEDLLGWTLRVRGKGGRTRMVPVPEGISAALRRLPDGWAFPGRVEGHLSAGWVGKLVSRALPGAWAMHSLRHRFGTDAYAASGADLLAVQQLLGHASPATTQRYVQVPSGVLRRTVEAVSRVA